MPRAEDRDVLYELDIDSRTEMLDHIEVQLWLCILLRENWNKSHLRPRIFKDHEADKPTKLDRGAS
jgi:hypothetical protein